MMSDDEEWQSDPVQEMSTRFLLSIIRNGQSHCTDTECFSEFQPYEPVINNMELYDMIQSFILFAALYTLFNFLFDRIKAAFHMLKDNLKRYISDNNNGNTPPRPPPPGPTVN